MIFTKTTHTCISIQENAFENVVFKMCESGFGGIS